MTLGTINRNMNTSKSTSSSTINLVLWSPVTETQTHPSTRPGSSPGTRLTSSASQLPCFWQNSNEGPQAISLPPNLIHTNHVAHAGPHRGGENTYGTLQSLHFILSTCLPCITSRNFGLLHVNNFVGKVHQRGELTSGASQMTLRSRLFLDSWERARCASSNEIWRRKICREAPKG